MLDNPIKWCNNHLNLPTDKYYTRNEAIEILGVPGKAFDNYYKNSGELKRVEGERLILFRKKDIEDFKKLKDNRTIKIMLLAFNWAKQILKITRDFEPALGEPRRARRASVSIPFRASRGRINRQNS